MISLTHHLKSWRYITSLHHHHHHHHRRLLTYTTFKSESDNTHQENSFGRLAARNEKNRIKSEFNTTGKFTKEYKILSESSQRYSESKNSSQLPQDNTLIKWHNFRTDKLKETSARWSGSGGGGGGGQQDDAEEDYQYLVSKNALRSGQQGHKDALEKTTEISEIHGASDDVSTGTEILHEPKFAKFGGVSLSPFSDEGEGDEGDLREERYNNAKHERKHRPHFYGFKMKRLCKERKLSEAIKILEEEMPAAGTKPDNFCFQVLINACGRAGYTKKAFKLYNQMKKRGLKVEPVTYTGLFLACAHSPWPTTDGLQRATHLRSQLRDKQFQFNQIICHVMIKAFGWCGDMSTAFQVVDDMTQDGVAVTTETINFLLQACITNKEVGFRHAVKVWRKMRELKLQPDIHSYNLLMRVIKDCGAGDPNLTIDLLKEENKQHKLDKPNQRTNKQKLIPEVLNVEVKSEKNLISISEDSVVYQGESNSDVQTVSKKYGEGALPNVLGKKLTAGDVVALGALDQPQDRLALVGGPRSIVMQMKRDKVMPNLKTFTQMLESLPPQTQVEEALLESMKNLKLEPDTQFFNMLIKKRNFRHDIKAAQEVVTLMQQHHLIPDLITYGCLALGCRNIHSASQLLKDMDDSNFRPNIEIMTTLVKNGLVRQDYVFALAMLREMQHRSILPDDFLLSMLERARRKARDLLLGEHDKNTKVKEGKKKGAEMFLSGYKVWLQDSKVEVPEHPWTQYR